MDPTQLDPSLWSQFGPFATVFVVMTTLGGGIILWLLRDRTALRRERSDGDQRERDLYDRIIATNEQFIPLMERLLRAVERSERA